MIRNYFKIAWRKLKKNRLYSFVNILGLTAGLASCLLIGLYLVNELSYDRFHHNADRIVRLTTEFFTLQPYVSRISRVPQPRIRNP